MSELERTLARELHGFALQLKTTIAEDDSLSRAIDDLRALRAGWATTPRPRWFDGMRPGGPGSEIGLNFNDYSLFRGRANPLAAALEPTLVTLPDGRRAVEARVTCNQLYEGPPHGVHGGYVAGLFDDVLGGTIRLAAGGPAAVTGTLEVKYRKITPLDIELRFVAWVHHTSGRRIHSKATCHAGDVLTAEADALFVRVDMSALADGQADYRPRGA